MTLKLLEANAIADVVEVKRGEWLEQDIDYISQCSNCLKFSKCVYPFSQKHGFNYCPNCGADMRGRVK